MPPDSHENDEIVTGCPENGALPYSYAERRYWDICVKYHATKKKKTRIMKRTPLRTFDVKFSTCRLGLSLAKFMIRP